jgi:hypothetical protein
MLRFLVQMGEAGASARDVCFLVHKFIPARTGAWARADPASAIVRVDALWGVPDGLQSPRNGCVTSPGSSRSVLTEHGGS